jgi:hypothetical protein
MYYCLINVHMNLNLNCLGSFSAFFVFSILSYLTFLIYHSCSLSCVVSEQVYDLIALSIVKNFKEFREVLRVNTCCVRYPRNCIMRAV